MKKENWIKAIEDDGLIWHNVSDLKYWNNEAAQDYAVSSIPSNVLIDENGIIIAKNLRGEDLRKKVEEILKECMEKAVKINVPLTVSSGTGSNLYELK
jgi:hypothetical protein